MNDRASLELALRSLAAGRNPTVGDALVFTSNGWTFAPGSGGNIEVIISEDAPPVDPPVGDKIVLWLRVAPVD